MPHEKCQRVRTKQKRGNEAPPGAIKGRRCVKARVRTQTSATRPVWRVELRGSGHGIWSFYCKAAREDVMNGCQETEGESQQKK